MRTLHFQFYLFCFTSVLLNSCKQASLIKNSGAVFGTTYSIIYSSSDDLNSEFQDIFTLLDQELSTYMPNSKLALYNKNEYQFSQKDSLFTKVFQESKKIYELTDHYFDPTSIKLLNAWGIGLKTEQKELTHKQVQELLQHTGFSLINTDFIKKDPEVELDFSAIAKGYSLDLIADYLDKKKISSYLIEIGGEIVSKGIKPNGNNWLVGIEKPQENTNLPTIKSQFIYQKIQLNNQALATSGNYRKFVEGKYQKKVHILNPKTGYPYPSDLLSVSVVAKNCLTADAYATAFMAMGKSKTIDFLHHHPELKVLLIYTQKSKLKSKTLNGFEDLFFLD